MNLVSKLEALRRSDMVMRLAAFLLCLSLLPGHAYAANESDLPQPPVIEEPLGPEPPEEPVMVMSEEVGLYEDDHL